MSTTKLGGQTYQLIQGNVHPMFGGAHSKHPTTADSKTSWWWLTWRRRRRSAAMNIKLVFFKQHLDHSGPHNYWCLLFNILQTTIIHFHVICPYFQIQNYDLASSCVEFLVTFLQKKWVNRTFLPILSDRCDQTMGGEDIEGVPSSPSYCSASSPYPLLLLGF